MMQQATVQQTQRIQIAPPKVVIPAQPRPPSVPRPAAPKTLAPAKAPGTALPGQGASAVPVTMTEAAPAAKRKKRKAETKVVHEQVKHYIPESALYCKLLELEHSMDALLHQKRADVAEVLSVPEAVPKKLRVYAYTQHQHQDAVPGSGDVPGWELVLYGRLIDATEADSGSPGDRPAPSYPGLPGLPGVAAGMSWQQQHTPHHPFQWYIQRLHIEMDSAVYPTNNSLTWRRENHMGPFKDKMFVRRAGNKEVDVKITLEPHTGIRMYNLSTWLSAFMGVNQATRGRVLSAIWAYIRDNKLINSSNPMQVDLDDRLQALLKCEKHISLDSIGGRLEALMKPPPPPVLEYTIKLDGPSPSAPACWDIEVWEPLPAAHDGLPPSVARLGRGDKDLEQLDQRLGSLHKRLVESKRRRDFYHSFSADPVTFIRSVVGSQGRDLRIAKQGSAQQYEAMQRSEFFKGKWVEDAVLRYLHRRLAAGA